MRVAYCLLAIFYSIAAIVEVANRGDHILLYATTSLVFVLFAEVHELRRGRET